MLRKARAFLTITAKRLAAQPDLAAASIFGLTLAVALTMSVPLYADAVYNRVFLSGVAGRAGAAQRSPFGYLFRYNGTAHGALQWQELAPVDDYLSTEAASTIGLPQKFVARHVNTSPFGLFPEGETSFSVTKKPITWASFSWISDFAAHVDVIEGRLPAAGAAVTDGQPIEALVSEGLAMRIGLQVGERYIAFFRSPDDTTAIPVEVVGVWRPRDPDEAYWYFDPDAFEDEFIVAEGTYAQAISAVMDDEVSVAVWYLALEGEKLQHHATDALIRGGSQAEQQAATHLPDIELVNSPVEALRAYRRSKRLLTVLLYAFSIPIVGLLLAFIGLVSRLNVERRRNEIAVLRSRGAPSRQVTGIAFFEGALLSVLALGVGSLLGLQLARLMAQSRGFLTFTEAPASLPVRLSLPALQLGALAIGLALTAQLLPAHRAAQDTIVTYKQQQARRLRKPWWQRMALDLLLLVPTGYGIYLLRQQGSVISPETALRGQLFQNPLLFLVPTLGLLSLTLLFLRVLPWLMSGVAWIAGHTKSVGMVMAARHLARTPQSYNTPLMLLVLTLSLSAFTATLAQTLNLHLHDRIYYQVGADMQFTDVGEQITEDVQAYLEDGQESEGEDQPADAATAAPGAAQSAGTSRWLFVPVTEYQRLSGVDAATRVGRYPATAQLSGVQQRGEFLGVDRVDFPAVAFWRDDFAGESLGALMNGLAKQPNGVLVPQDFMDEYGLRQGENLRLTVDTHGQFTGVDVEIVGSFDLFPTWYPEAGPLFVGNLDYLWQQAGGQFPYQVWMETERSADPQRIGDEGRRDLSLRLLNWTSSALQIREVEGRPERQGLFGVLSIGFGAAGLLTVLGFMLYALFSFRRRLIEFGVLRAIGLSSSSMTVTLTWELALLVILGGAVGTLLGTAMSMLFIPYLQVGAAPGDLIPPYTIEIAWRAVFRVYGLFALVFAMALTTLILTLRRMRIFQALKLGESA